VHRQFVKTSFPQGIDAGVVPDVRSITAMAAQFYIVDVRRSAVLENEDKLVLRAVELTHATVGLVPDAQMLELGV
jgi:hypothetical protein